MLAVLGQFQSVSCHSGSAHRCKTRWAEIEERGEAVQELELENSP